MKKIIDCCKSCPFLYTIVDNHTIVTYYTDICVFSKNLNLDNYNISSYNNDELNYRNTEKSPDWCPLKKENLVLNFEDEVEDITSEDDIQEKINKSAIEIGEQLKNLSKISDDLKIALKNIDNIK